MKITDLKIIFHNELNAIYGREEVESIFFICTEFYFDFPRIQLILQPEFTISKNEYDTVFKTLNRLKNNEPIQYILGETEFYGLKFKVNKHVLIPRQETEELVNWMIQSLKLKVKSQKFAVTSSAVEKSLQNQLNIFDVGTGSGCIAISLAKYLPNAKIYALDISDEALKVAKQNAQLNNVNIEFIKADIRDTLNWNLFFENLEFDIIVSNPPYVRQLEKAEIKPNVLDYEPHLALFVKDNNPLVFYDAIANFASKYLKPNGQLFFEINQYLGNETKQLLKDFNFKTIELRKDLNGNERMLSGTKIDDL